MLDFTIEPLVGVGPVKFGQTRGEVMAILAGLGQRKAARRAPHTDCFFASALQVSYGADGAVEFIEVALSKKFQVLFQGQSLHKIPADDAVRLVSQSAEYDKDDPEVGYTYIFPALQLALWRPDLPSDEPDDDTGRYFESVSAGKEGYYSR